MFYNDKNKKLPKEILDKVENNQQVFANPNTLHWEMTLNGETISYHAEYGFADGTDPVLIINTINNKGGINIPVLLPQVIMIDVLEQGWFHLTKEKGKSE
jgi:hypothetical protein